MPAANHVAVVDKDTEKTIAFWPLDSVARGNFPMALDEENRLLYIAFRRPGRLAVLELKKGKVIANIEISSDADDLFYSPRHRRAYITCGEGFVDVVEKLAGDKYKVVGKYPTAPGARTSLYIPELDRLLVAVPRRGEQSAEIRVYKPTQEEAPIPHLPNPKEATSTKPKSSK